jgi:hypothetical protein
MAYRSTAACGGVAGARAGGNGVRYSSESRPIEISGRRELARTNVDAMALAPRQALVTPTMDPTTSGLKIGMINPARMNSSAAPPTTRSRAGEAKRSRRSRRFCPSAPIRSGALGAARGPRFKSAFAAKATPQPAKRKAYAMPSQRSSGVFASYAIAKPIAVKTAHAPKMIAKRVRVTMARAILRERSGYSQVCSRLRNLCCS